MGNPPQAGFDPAQHDWPGGAGGVFRETPDQVAVNDRCPVGTAGILAAGGVIVAFTWFFQGGGIGHHRVDASGCHPPEETRLAQAANIIHAGEFRLGDHADAITGLHEHFADDGRTDKGAVDIAVARHQDNIQLIPAQPFRLHPLL